MEIPRASMKKLWGAVIVTLGLTLFPATVRSQVARNPAALQRTEIFLKITTGPEGPILSATEFKLNTGKYYRMNITSDGGKDWRLEVNDLLQNSHLRLVTISGIEVHLQGMAFRAIEFDVAGTAQFSFTPVRPGVFEFSVGNVPSARGRPIGESGRAAGAVLGRFIVEAEK